MKIIINDDREIILSLKDFTSLLSMSDDARIKIINEVSLCIKTLNNNKKYDNNLYNAKRKRHTN
jgi:hypothetical protein